MLRPPLPPPPPSPLPPIVGPWGYHHQSKCCCCRLLLKNCLFCARPGATWGERGGEGRRGLRESFVENLACTSPSFSLHIIVRKFICYCHCGGAVNACVFLKGRLENQSAATTTFASDPHIPPPTIHLTANFTPPHHHHYCCYMKTRTSRVRIICSTCSDRGASVSRACVHVVCTPTE